jgi:hypothetical protein
MSSRQYGRILTITLFLSAGASTLAHAQGPPSRSVSPRAGATVQERSAGHNLLEAVLNLWGEIRDFSWWPPAPPPPGDGGNPDHREGPGICPHGHM